LKEFPVFNSSFDEDKEEIVLKKYYNVGFAVDTPEGLLVPVVKAADKKGILDISRELQELSEGARSRNILLEKLQNGTFTITNYGALGASSGIPVIRHPEAAILGIGRIGKKPVVNEQDEILVRSIMNISLCIDHRIIDGGEAGRFLNKLKAYLEEPMLLLLG
jgi:pyruvate dehydrogenase E2 component (dihydrolipoamide acetyltransferase)